FRLLRFFFSFNATPTTYTYTLSLHDALPILFAAAPQAGSRQAQFMIRHPNNSGLQMDQLTHLYIPAFFVRELRIWQGDELVALRSEEHTSELQSRFDLVCRLLLEKKKKNRIK